MEFLTNYELEALPCRIFPDVRWITWGPLSRCSRSSWPWQRRPPHKLDWRFPPSTIRISVTATSARWGTGWPPWRVYPGIPLTYYVGAASGGIWRSKDGGEHWRPVFDDQPDHSIGALAVAPSDPKIVWAGTGETHIRSNVSLGTGVYKSTDGGETWHHMGLAGPSRTSRIVIHPKNSDIVYVAALGHSHGPQAERGVFRTEGRR